MSRFRRNFRRQVKRVNYDHLKVSGNFYLSTDKIYNVTQPQTIVSTQGTRVQENIPVLMTVNQSLIVDGLVNDDNPKSNGVGCHVLVYLANQPCKITGFTIWVNFMPDIVNDEEKAQTVVGYNVYRLQNGENAKNDIGFITIGNPLTPGGTPSTTNSGLLPTHKTPSELMLAGSGHVYTNGNGQMINKELANKTSTSRKLDHGDKVYLYIYNSDNSVGVLCNVQIVAFIAQ